MPKQSEEQKALPSYDLRAERETRKLTQIEVAKILFATQSSVARWEADGTLPQLHREYWRLYWLTKPVKVGRKTANKLLASGRAVKVVSNV